MLEDLVDIICSDKETKKMLIFRNQKFAANNVLYQKVVLELNQRIKGYQKSFPFELTVTQARSKFKKLISECKAQSLTQRTATGLSRYKVEKGYGEGGINYFLWWLVENHQIEATILRHLQIQILMKKVLKGQSKKN